MKRGASAPSLTAAVWGFLVPLFLAASCNRGIFTLGKYIYIYSSPPPYLEPHHFLRLTCHLISFSPVTFLVPLVIPKQLSN